MKKETKKPKKTDKSRILDCNSMIGQWLKKEREESELSPAALAKRIGKPVSFVKEYEAGKIGVEIGTYMLIAKKLQADPLDGIELLMGWCVID